MGRRATRRPHGVLDTSEYRAWAFFCDVLPRPFARRGCSSGRTEIRQARGPNCDGPPPRAVFVSGAEIRCAERSAARPPTGGAGPWDISGVGGMRRSRHLERGRARAGRILVRRVTAPHAPARVKAKERPSIGPCGALIRPPWPYTPIASFARMGGAIHLWGGWQYNGPPLSDLEAPHVWGIRRRAARRKMRWAIPPIHPIEPDCRRPSRKWRPAGFGICIVGATARRNYSAGDIEREYCGSLY